MNGRITEAPAYLRGHCTYVFRCDCPRHQGQPILGDDTIARVEAHLATLTTCSQVS